VPNEERTEEAMGEEKPQLAAKGGTAVFSRRARWISPPASFVVHKKPQGKREKKDRGGGKRDGGLFAKSEVAKTQREKNEKRAMGKGVIRLFDLGEKGKKAAGKWGVQKVIHAGASKNGTDSRIAHDGRMGGGDSIENFRGSLWLGGILI